MTTIIIVMVVKQNYFQYSEKNENIIFDTKKGVLVIPIDIYMNLPKQQ